MEILLFNKMEFRQGLNFTARLGEKWANRVSPGDNILLVSTDLCSCKPATITAVFVCDLAHVPIEVLANHHDLSVIKCRDLITLLIECYSELKGRDVSKEIFTYLGFKLNRNR